MTEPLDMPDCSLSPPELVDRAASWSQVAPALVDRSRTGAGIRLRYARSPHVHQSLRALAAAERDCCGWASWDLTDEGDHLVLEVTGPAEKIAPLAAAFGV